MHLFIVLCCFVVVVYCVCVCVCLCVAGATLVQWSRLSGDLIASAHDSDIRIWDRRVRGRANLGKG